MGVLREVKGERAIELPPRVLIGRSRQADLELPHSWVSGEHAVLWWDGRIWRLRDLSSRNGTTVDGRPFESRDGVALTRGVVIAIGQAETAWRLDDDGPPTPMAVAGDGTVRLAADDVIGLPTESDPRVVVYRDGDRWLVTVDGAERPAADRTGVVVDGESWTLRLPEGSTATGDGVGAISRLDELRLELDVSRDQESVDVRLLTGSAQSGLEPRTYHYLLALLAKQRLEDRADGVAPADEGWIDAEVLCEMLRVRRDVLNVHVYRIRRQFVGAGVVDGKDVIERRPLAHQLRLAVTDVAVRWL